MFFVFLLIKTNQIDEKDRQKYPWQKVYTSGQQNCSSVCSPISLDVYRNHVDVSWSGLDWSGPGKMAFFTGFASGDSQVVTGTG